MLPIFLQDRVGAPWRALSPCRYIEADLPTLVLRCELDVETGLFSIAHLVNRHEETDIPIWKHSQQYKALHDTLQDCGYTFPFKGLEPDSEVGNPYFEIRFCAIQRYGPGGKHVQKKARPKIIKALEGFVSDVSRTPVGYARHPGSYLDECEGIRVLLPLGKGERMIGISCR